MYLAIITNSVCGRIAPYDQSIGQPNFEFDKNDMPESDEDKQAMKKAKATYLTVLGGVMWLTQTRPDLCHAVGQLSKAASNPGPKHVNALKHCVRYIAGTRHYSKVFNGNAPDKDRLVGYVDSDWAGDKSTRRSTTGYALFFNGGAISAKSQIQKLVAMSSMEAELIALCAAALAAVFIRNILKGFRKPQAPTVIYEDNNAAAVVAQSAVIQRRARHIDLRYFKIRELVATNQVRIDRVNSADNCADVFTKNVGPLTLYRHLPMLLGSDQRVLSKKTCKTICKS